MPNSTLPIRAWQLLQQMEVAYTQGQYDKVVALADMARTYQAFATGPDAAFLTAVFTWAAVASNVLALDFAANTVTAATAPTDAEVVWNFGDGFSYVVTNKALTSNFATLTTAGAHGFVVGEKVLVTTGDPTFDQLATLTAVTANTFTYAKTASNVTSVAQAGTAYPAGVTHRHIFSGNGLWFVTMTVDTAALLPVTYGINVRVPYSIS